MYATICFWAHTLFANLWIEKKNNYSTNEHQVQIFFLVLSSFAFQSWRHPKSWNASFIKSEESKAWCSTINFYYSYCFNPFKAKPPFGKTTVEFRSWMNTHSPHKWSLCMDDQFYHAMVLFYGILLLGILAIFGITEQCIQYWFQLCIACITLHVLNRSTLAKKKNNAC